MRATLLESVAARLDPSHAAVLVIDMQNDFCAREGYVETVVGKDVGACRAVVKPIMALVSSARKAGVPVFWIKANYDPDKIPVGMLAKQRERSTSVCCGSGSWGGEFFEVEPQIGEAVIEKHCYSAFRGTDLDTRLRALLIRTVVLAGVQTNVCVETTLRDAVCVGLHAVIAADCVASHTQLLHEATLANTRFLFGDVLSRDEIAAHWRQAA